MLVVPHSAAIAATAALTRQTARSAEHVFVSSHLFIAFSHTFRRIAVYPIYDVIIRS